MTQAQISRKYDVSQAAISQRVRRLGLSTIAAQTGAPEESRRHVRRTIDAMEELVGSLDRIKLLMDACDEWLRDADDPSRYDIGARSDEILVTWQDRSSEPARVRKESLGVLLDRAVGRDEVRTWESRHADPRELVLKTAQEVRQIVSTVADLARTIADVRLMEMFRQMVLAEISKESPDCASRIAESVRRALVCRELFNGPDALAAFAGSQDPDTLPRLDE